MKRIFLILASFTFSLSIHAQPQGWQHSGELTILTTHEGANLPEGAALENFPLLVRISKDWFDFSQAKPNGEDVRFSAADGTPLSFQIEEWDAIKGEASIWVRMPRIEGNARQTLRIHWGKPDAQGESNPKAVFNESNGYVSVWHMSETIADDVGTLESKDNGTTPAVGIVGKARHFAGQKGVFCGDKIPNLPSGDSAHSTQAWFRAERPNTTIIGWGNEGGGRGSKVRMQFRSPPHLHIDSDFSDVDTAKPLPMNQWIQVTHTYDGSEGEIYLNGQLEGSANPKMDIRSPARLWLGGWYNNYDFIGDLDEVRLSKVARSADWVRLEYENQKPFQTLVGPIIQPGAEFTVSSEKITVSEGQRATITAQAGGAQKIYWTLKRNGLEQIVATDRFAFTFDAGRVTGNTTANLQFKAIFADGVKTKDIAITTKEAIPEPIFTLRAPTKWDGRTLFEITPKIANLAAMQAKGAGDVNVDWSVAPFAVIKETSLGKLRLMRALNSGKLTVTATMNNGGAPISQSVTFTVNEPKHDVWTARTPDKEEKPEDNQFYARDDKNEGTLFCTETLETPADAVFLKVIADGQPYKAETRKIGPDKSYAFAVKLKPGLIKYKVEFGTKLGATETVLHTANNIVCGDAYLIDGQSNAVAMDWGKGDFPETSDWIRTFGSMGGDPKSASWGNAIRKALGDRLAIGYWGFDLAKHLVESQKIPIFIINGAVGGTRIDQHQRNNENPEDLTTIYGRLLWRVQQAHLTHGIRGVLWHQGENDQGSDGPTGGYGWETYRQYFMDMAAAWKQDYPNIQNYYAFQIWPKSCAMGRDGSDNRLREVQRQLPTAFSNLSIMSTLGIEPPGGCHYPPEGYAQIARLIAPLVERDNYRVTPTTSTTPPNLEHATYSPDNTAIVLKFDQKIKWDDALLNEFYLDGETGKITSGSVTNDLLTLKLAAPTLAKKITYLDSKSWSQTKLLRGENGIAALSFCEVPILPAKARP